jgi:hypothetical protein
MLLNALSQFEEDFCHSTAGLSYLHPTIKTANKQTADLVFILVAFTFTLFGVAVDAAIGIVAFWFVTPFQYRHGAFCDSENERTARKQRDTPPASGHPKQPNCKAC